MRDQVFTGPTVPDAVKAAGEALGLPPASVRYIVLEEETAGGRGIKPTPARIAVMLDAAARPPAPPARPIAPEPAAGDGGDGEDEDEDEEDGGPLTVEEEISEILEEFARTARAAPAQVESTDAGWRVVLEPGLPAAVGEALGHVLEKVAQRDGDRRQVSVHSGDQQWGRAHTLREQALAAARTVLETGALTALPPLSAFERRLVHMALQDLPGVRTYSEGTGHERRVIVAPAEAATPASPATHPKAKEAPEVM